MRLKCECALLRLAQVRANGCTLCDALNLATTPVEDAAAFAAVAPGTGARLAVSDVRDGRRKTRCALSRTSSWERRRSSWTRGAACCWSSTAPEDPAAVPQPDAGEITECGYWPPDAVPRPVSDFTVRRIRDAPVPANRYPLPVSIGPRRWLK